MSIPFSPGANLYTQGFGSRPENVEVPHYDVRAPGNSDILYPLGKIWLNTSTGIFYGLGKLSVSAGVTTATWTQLGTAGSSLTSLTTEDSTIVVPTAGNINVIGTDTIQTTGSGSTVTITATASGFPITPYVVGPSGQAGYQTIQAAINAAHANGGGLVWVRSGTYTENLTLYDKIFINGDGVLSAIDDTAGTFIVGTHTPPLTGACSFNALDLVSSTDILFSNAAGTAQINISNASLDITSGYCYNMPNWTGILGNWNCNSNGVNDGFINNTAGAPCYMYEVGVGSGTGHTAIISGIYISEGSAFYCPVTFQTGANFQLDDFQFQNGPVTFSGNATGLINCVRFTTGSAAAIVMDSSASISISTGNISSTATNPIQGTGAGTLKLSNICFLQNSAIANTVTTAYGSSVQGATTVTGNLTLGAAGNKIDSTSVASTTTAGANSFGTVALVLGTATVDTSAVTASSMIFVTVQALGTVSTAKAIAVTAKTASTSFVLTSSDATDTSTIAWFIVN